MHRKCIDCNVLAHCNLLIIQDIQWDNPYGSMGKIKQRESKELS